MDKMLGVMIDCSRNAVMKIETVKKYANIVKRMGYNTLMLYTEDTYEIDAQPYFGHLRGRYSKEELKDLDRFCSDIEIELIPCVQTLAHLESMFKWYDRYDDINDCDDVLLIGNEKTYRLIEDMISTVAECFSSRKIHIGMDEAYRVGAGKYKKEHGEKDKFDIINAHLHKVCGILKKYNFEPMIWSDMFYSLALNIDDQFGDVDKKTANSKIVEMAKLPDEVSLVYWDYYSKDYENYQKRIAANKLFDRKLYFAGGAWTWKGFAPDNKLSMETTEVAIKACRDNGVEDMFFTMWGDDGSECSKFSVLPSLMYAAELWNGNTDIESIKKKFKDLIGCEFDDFMLLDKFDMPMKYPAESLSKCILYNDLFLGIRNNLEKEEYAEYYKNLSLEISGISEKGEFDYLFKKYEKFAELLSVKCALGLKTKDAYKKRDTETLLKLIENYDVLISKIEKFYKSYRDVWFKENKPHGFDIQDIRIGGLIQRVKSCTDRLRQFADGEIEVIEELEEPSLDEYNGFSHWSRIVTPNIISHSY